MPRKPKSTLQSSKESPSAKSVPTHEEIALRAYEIFLERAGAPGDALQDWTRAERELLKKSSKAKGKIGPTLVAA